MLIKTISDIYFTYVSFKLQFEWHYNCIQYVIDFFIQSFLGIALVTILTEKLMFSRNVLFVLFLAVFSSGITTKINAMSCIKKTVAADIESVGWRQKVRLWVQKHLPAMHKKIEQMESDKKAKLEQDLTDTNKKIIYLNNGKALLESLLGEKFYNSNPFQTLEKVSSIMEIVDRGVISFDRRIFRTQTNISAWNNGYDVVVYEVKHSDGGTSVIQAAMQSDNPFSVMMIGGADLRSTHVMVYTDMSDGKMNYRWYVDGVKKHETLGANAAQGLDAARNFVNQSLENRGFVELEVDDVNRPI